MCQMVSAQLAVLKRLVRVVPGTLLFGAAAFYVASDLAAAVGFLTVAKVLKVLRKIKSAVAPCCCSHEAPAEEEHIADVVEEESK